MGNRFKTFLILAIAMAFTVFSFGPVVADQSKVVLVGGGQAYLPLDDFVLESESATIAGDSWYVDSGKTASGDGKSWDYAVITINEAYDLATASNGDVIHVAVNSDETIDAATDLVCDKIGITIIGYGSGSERPTLSWADVAAATIPVSAADNVFKNIIFDGSSTAGDGPDAMFTITAAGFQLIRSEIIISDANEAATVVITGSAAADHMKVLGNRFFGTIAGAGIGCDSAVTFSAAAEDIEIAYNTFEGDFAEGALDSGSAVTQMNAHHNYIWNAHNGVEAIHFDGAVTGTIAYTQVVTDAYGTAIDAGSCDVFETYWADDGAHDAMAVQVLTNEDGATPWSATELAIMESEANDALVDEGLDYLVKVAAGTSAAYPSNVTALSVLAYIMAVEGAISDYDEATDSLEAIADHVQTLITTTAGSDAYPSGVTNESIIAYILSASATPAASSFDNETDSLEALRDNQDTGVLLGAGIHLDHLMALDGATSKFPEQAVEDSTICKILGDDDPAVCTTYDNSTDSLEALGIKTEQIAGADGVVSYPAAELPASGVSLAEVLREIYDQQEKAVSGSTAVMVNGDTLFTIANGPIEVVSLVSVCVADATESTASTLQYSHNPTAGAAATFSGASASLETVDGGASVVLQGTTLATAPLVNVSGAGINASGGISVILQPGIVTAVIGVGTTTSTWTHYLRYKPLARGVTVTGT